MGLHVYDIGVYANKSSILKKESAESDYIVQRAKGDTGNHNRIDGQSHHLENIQTETNNLSSIPRK